jgi:hypothetical protein
MMDNEKIGNGAGMGFLVVLFRYVTEEHCVCFESFNTSYPGNKVGLESQIDTLASLYANDSNFFSDSLGAMLR